jgi:hypothetical protein
MEETNETIDYVSLQNSKQIKKKYIAQSWNLNEEDILQVWAEKASGWAWLHDKSQRYYLQQSNIFTYPSIILNTISGGIGFLGKSNDISYLAYIIATMNIISAILMSFQKFLRSTENAELHSRYFSVFSSYSRRIALELTLNPEDRRECVEFCKQCKDDYDKAVAESPQIPDNIIIKFKKEFPDEKNKPEVANGLFHLNRYSYTPKAVVKGSISPKIKRSLGGSQEFNVTIN